MLKYFLLFNTINRRQIRICPLQNAIFSKICFQKFLIMQRLPKDHRMSRQTTTRDCFDQHKHKIERRENAGLSVRAQMTASSREVRPDWPSIYSGCFFSATEQIDEHLKRFNFTASVY